MPLAPEVLNPVARLLDALLPVPFALDDGRLQQDDEFSFSPGPGGIPEQPTDARDILKQRNAGTVVRDIDLHQSAQRDYVSVLDADNGVGFVDGALRQRKRRIGPAHSEIECE